MTRVPHLTSFADTLAPNDLVHLTGDVDVHAVVVERHARALVVRWHGHLYRVTGEVAEREEGDTGAPRWRVRAFEPWVAAEKRARSRRRAQGGRC